ncbi:MAG: glycogen debranching protein GlgX [Myxococcota bacterium]
MDIWPGAPYPLGARFDGSGTGFAVFSSSASVIELCLFDDQGRERRVILPSREGHVWHGYLPDVGPGQRYGFRAHGTYEPERGARCHPYKLLVDPYARAIEGSVRWDESVFSYPFDAPDAAGLTDSAPFVPKSIVVSPFFDWGLDRAPNIPLDESVILEVHVRGFTARHPELPEHLRGSYAGLAHPAVVEHLTGLGVTAVELLPVHHFVHAKSLIDRGLRNYWGYDTLGYFAPHSEYSSSGDRGQQVTEFKHMVRTLHTAGIEVIIDVVYNHTCEGNHLGPTLSMKGLDNQSYYRLVEGQEQYYMDYTGCGNTVDVRSPFALQMVTDSLRYWAEEMRVDGFRFDLATAVSRETNGFDPFGGFLDIMQQDPILRQKKLFAEPWDVGEGGYQVGAFPAYWSEWNGKYRDDMRDFWRGEDGRLGVFARRLTGSADIYEHHGRPPRASVNFVTCHDGFTLRDLVSYNEKHNAANGEDNRDGESHNRSWNCGAEGETDDRAILSLRARQQRNLLSTLLLSQGIPLLLGGDEMGRTQRGNNNPYCQDNEISWIDWEAKNEELFQFTAQLVRLRRSHPVLRQRRWVHGRDVDADHPGVIWFRPDGVEMSKADWDVAFARSITVYLNGRSLAPDSVGATRMDRSFLLMFNASHDDLFFVIPPHIETKEWVQALDTAAVGREFRVRSMKRRRRVQITGRSVKILMTEA